MRRSRLAKALRPLRERLELWLARGGIALVSALPEATALALGAWLGRASAVVLRRRTRVAIANLHLVFPDWSAAHCRGVARASAQEFGRSGAEWARLPGLSPEALRARVELVGLQHVEAALASGRPILAATAHYGNWEMLPAALRVLLPEIRLVVVGRTLRNEALYRLIRDRRTQGGGELLAQDARAILRALRAGAAVGVLVDQYTTQRKGGVLVPFLGLQAWTNAGPALLALRTNAVVLTAHVERVEGARHRVVIDAPIELSRSGDRATDVREATLQIAARVERWIRTDPSPWLWSHRRFRRSPDAAPDLYD